MRGVEVEQIPSRAREKITKTRVESLERFSSTLPPQIGDYPMIPRR